MFFLVWPARVGCSRAGWLDENLWTGGELTPRAVDEANGAITWDMGPYGLWKSGVIKKNRPLLELHFHLEKVGSLDSKDLALKWKRVKKGVRDKCYTTSWGNHHPLWPARVPSAEDGGSAACRGHQPWPLWWCQVGPEPTHRPHRKGLAG